MNHKDKFTQLHYAAISAGTLFNRFVIPSQCNACCGYPEIDRCERILRFPLCQTCFHFICGE